MNSFVVACLQCFASTIASYSGKLSFFGSNHDLLIGLESLISLHRTKFSPIIHFFRQLTHDTINFLVENDLLQYLHFVYFKISNHFKRTCFCRPFFLIFFQIMNMYSTYHILTFSEQMILNFQFFGILFQLVNFLFLFFN